MKVLKLSDAMHQLQPSDMPAKYHRRLQKNLGLKPGKAEIINTLLLYFSAALFSSVLIVAWIEDIPAVISSAVRHDGIPAALSAAFESFNPYLLFLLFTAAAVYSAGGIFQSSFKGKSI